MNEEHFNILERGVDVWNQWRRDNPDIRPDLHRASVARRHLDGIDLRGADLTHSYWSGTSLRKADLSCADAFSADFVGVDLSGANLAETYLSAADLSGANLDGADLSGASICKYTALPLGVNVAKCNKISARIGKVR